MEDNMRIYNRCQSYESELEKLKKADISSNNKQLIKRFCDHKLGDKGISLVRVVKQLSQLKQLSKWFGKDLDKVEREDISKILAMINTSALCVRRIKSGDKIYETKPQKYSVWTRKDYLMIIKEFFRWLHGKTTPLVEDLSMEFDKRTQIRNIVTNEHIEQVLKSTESLKDRAFLSLLHESGARIGEILNMKIKDITKQNGFTKVRLNGKTGERHILIITSVPYIYRYLETHPLKDKPESHLWICEDARRKNKPLEYMGAKRIIERCLERAKLSHLPSNPHHFRHSRATINANWMTETQMCLYFGWTLGSDQVSTYVHASGRDADKAILRMNGLEQEEKVDLPNKPKTCPICKTVNESIASFCCNCGKPLTLKIALESEERIKEETDKSIKLLMEVFKDPELLQSFEKFKREHSS